MCMLPGTVAACCREVSPVNGNIDNKNSKKCSLNQCAIHFVFEFIFMLCKQLTMKILFQMLMERFVFKSVYHKYLF